MKENSAILTTLLLLAVAACSLAAEETAPPVAGSVKEPVALQLSVAPGSLDQPLAFHLIVENRSETDVIVNLGQMLANGKVMMPDAVRLMVQDAAGNSRELLFADHRFAGVRGKVESYLVPLRARSAYSLNLSLQDYWCPGTNGTKEFQPITLQPGEYHVHAVLESKAVRDGIKGTNVWKGTSTSAAIALRIEEHVDTGIDGEVLW